jgi:hypothetical protein
MFAQLKPQTGRRLIFSPIDCLGGSVASLMVAMMTVVRKIDNLFATASRAS